MDVESLFPRLERAFAALRIPILPCISHRRSSGLQRNVSNERKRTTPERAVAGGTDPTTHTTLRVEVQKESVLGTRDGLDVDLSRL